MNIKQKTIATVTCIAVISLFHSSSLISKNTTIIEGNNNLTAAASLVFAPNEQKSEIEDKKKSEPKDANEKIEETEQENETETEEQKNIVYDGMTLEELSAKLDRSLNSTLAGKGSTFASYSIELGLDPYLALAIVLEETGCKWECSELVKQCNNVGGQKGSPGCWGGSYRSFPTLDEGIKGYLDNLYYNYYAKGLTTPEMINPIYAESTSWASKVNNYIEQIRNA